MQSPRAKCRATPAGGGRAAATKRQRRGHQSPRPVGLRAGRETSQLDTFSASRQQGKIWFPSWVCLSEEFEQLCESRRISASNARLCARCPVAGGALPTGGAISSETATIRVRMTLGRASTAHVPRPIKSRPPKHAGPGEHFRTYDAVPAASGLAVQARRHRTW